MCRFLSAVRTFRRLVSCLSPRAGIVPPRHARASTTSMPAPCRIVCFGANAHPQAIRTCSSPARGPKRALRGPSCTFEWPPTRLPGRVVADLHEHLAEVAAGEHAAERLGGVLQSDDDVLAVAHRPVGDPPGHVAG